MADRTLLLQTCEAEAENFELCWTTENGVLAQIWTAPIIVLLQMYRKKFKAPMELFKPCLVHLIEAHDNERPSGMG